MDEQTVDNHGNHHFKAERKFTLSSKKTLHPPPHKKPLNPYLKSPSFLLDIADSDVSFFFNVLNRILKLNLLLIFFILTSVMSLNRSWMGKLSRIIIRSLLCCRRRSCIRRHIGIFHCQFHILALGILFQTYQIQM